MVNRACWRSPIGGQQWTISVQHTGADIDSTSQFLEEIAPALAKAQQERGPRVCRRGLVN